MQHLKILNRKEKNQLIAILEEQYGFQGELDYTFLLSKKNKMYLVNNDFARIDTSKLRIDSVGMYFGEIVGNQMRVSIEGSQLIGSQITKNIAIISKAVAKLWLHGHDLEFSAVEIKEGTEGFVIVKSINSINNSFSDDFLGCGKITTEKLANYISKNRCLKTSD